MRLGALTRLAYAMGASNVWRRVRTLMRESPVAAIDVVAAAPWDDLSDDVCAAILSRVDESDVCVAVAAARGRRDAAMTDITGETRADGGVARRGGHAHRAVRSPGLRQMFWRGYGAPSIASIPVVSMRPTTRRSAPRCRPSHCAGTPPPLRCALIPSMPSPPFDPGACFCIDGGGGAPAVIAPAHATQRTGSDRARAVILPCSALCGGSRPDLTPFMALLSAHARTPPHA